METNIKYGQEIRVLTNETKIAVHCVRCLNYSFAFWYANGYYDWFRAKCIQIYGFYTLL